MHESLSQNPCPCQGESFGNVLKDRLIHLGLGFGLDMENILVLKQGQSFGNVLKDRLIQEQLLHFRVGEVLRRILQVIRGQRLRLGCRVYRPLGWLGCLSRPACRTRVGRRRSQLLHFLLRFLLERIYVRFVVILRLHADEVSTLRRDEAQLFVLALLVAETPRARGLVVPSQIRLAQRTLGVAAYESEGV